MAGVDGRPLFATVPGVSLVPPPSHAGGEAARSPGRAAGAAPWCSSSGYRFRYAPPREPQMLSMTMAAFARGTERQRESRLLTPRPLADIADASVAIASKKLKVVPIKGDGKCMFRALAQGLAANRGMILTPKKEEEEADELRRLVHSSLCLSRTADEETAMREKFADAIFSISHGDQVTLPKYCTRVSSPTHWGGEPEILVLSKLLRTPIAVWAPPKQRAGKVPSGAFRLVSVYGKSYTKSTGTKKGKEPVCLLFNESAQHYDLLL